MSLLKVSHPRSILIKSDSKKQTKNVVKIRSSLQTNKLLNITPGPMDQDLQLPSELFECRYVDEKADVKQIPNEYYFESDHEALRSNPDYLALLKTYAILQAKKIQVFQF